MGDGWQFEEEEEPYLNFFNSGRLKQLLLPLLLLR
jgi:hypothetical protein